MSRTAPGGPSRLAEAAPKVRLYVRKMLFPERGAGELRDRAERRLDGVEAEAEVLVREGRVEVGRLVPVRVPAGAGVHATLVLAQADRGNEVHERRGIGVGHMRADGGRIVGRVLLVGSAEEERQLHRLV